MRILVTNPDTIGDLVLRGPMFGAFLEEGHELGLIVQPLVAPLVPLVAPGAEVIELPLSVYHVGLTPDAPALDPVSEAARAFEADVLVAAPWQWTVLESRLARDLEGARRVALAGEPFWHPDYGPPPAWGVAADERVRVDRDSHELEKNRALVRAVLGRGKRLEYPRIEADEVMLRAADKVLAGLGLEAGEYWVACVGHTAFTEVRNWPVEKWAEALSEWIRAHDRRFLLIGHESEREAARAVADRVEGGSGALREWFGSEREDLTTLAALIARSGGYVGRDTGPMHLAAALGKPVLAVFGAGTWPRFVPASKTSVAITVGVPTSGCGWDCGVDSAYGIREVPVEEVVKAASRLEAGRVKRRTTRVIEPSRELLERIASEGVERLQLARTAVMQARHEARGREGLIRELIGAVRQGAASASERRKASDVQAGELQALRQELHRARARIGELEERSVESARAAARAEGEASALRERLVELDELRKERERLLGELEGAAASRARAEVELARAQEEAEAARARLASVTEEAALAREEAKAAQNRLGSASEETRRTAEELARAEETLEGLRAERGALGQELERRAREGEVLRDRLGEAERAREALERAGERAREELGEARAHLEEEREAGCRLRRRVEALEGQAEKLRSRLNEVNARADELEIELERRCRERGTLAALGHQQERELVVVRRQVNELLASRWRKLGQAIGVAMVLPWEREMRNGKSNADG